MKKYYLWLKNLHTLAYEVENNSIEVLITKMNNILHKAQKSPYMMVVHLPATTVAAKHKNVFNILVLSTTQSYHTPQGRPTRILSKRSYDHHVPLSIRIVDLLFLLRC
jgi:hypothetical protein